MQEIAPGGFQIMWKPSAVPSTANPATSSSMFRRKNEHPMKIMITFVGGRYTNDHNEPHKSITTIECRPC